MSNKTRSALSGKKVVFSAFFILMSVVFLNEEVCLDEEPPFGEPGAACRFEMSDEAPAGPWGPWGGN